MLRPETHRLRPDAFLTTDEIHPWVIIVTVMKAYLSLLVFTLLLSGCGIGPDMSKDRVPRSPSPTPWQGEKTVQQNIQDGDTAFAAKEYDVAAKAYRLAFEQEKMKPTLEKKAWYSLVDNLAMAYMLSGDNNNARVVLAAGLSRNYDYPMFHYILARTHAAEGNEDEALLHLSRAFRHKKNMIAGEKFPDPLTDESFASLADSPSFKKAVNEMKAGK